MRLRQADRVVGHPLHIHLFREKFALFSSVGAYFPHVAFDVDRLQVGF